MAKGASGRAAIFLGLALSAAAGLSAYVVLARAEPGPSYRLARVEQGPLVSAITATGTMSALVTVEVSSQLSGQIAELYADFNSRVTSGQILARLNGDQLAARLAQAGADVDSAKAALIQQQALHDKARARALSCSACCWMSAALAESTSAPAWASRAASWSPFSRARIWPLVTRLLKSAYSSAIWPESWELTSTVTSALMVPVAVMALTSGPCSTRASR